MPAPAKPTLDPETGARITNEGALLGILNWMGAYEGSSGETLDTLLHNGADDATITGLDAEGIPADVLAGYRYAEVALLAIYREQEVEAAVARLRQRFPQAKRSALLAAVRNGTSARYGVAPVPRTGG